MLKLAENYLITAPMLAVSEEQRQGTLMAALELSKIVAETRADYQLIQHKAMDLLQGHYTIVSDYITELPQGNTELARLYHHCGDQLQRSIHQLECCVEQMMQEALRSRIFEHVSSTTRFTIYGTTQDVSAWSYPGVVCLPIEAHKNFFPELILLVAPYTLRETVLKQYSLNVLLCNIEKALGRR